jgi:hypothetical protein
VETILLEDVIATLTSKIAIMKIDVESLECKVAVLHHLIHRPGGLSYKNLI